jgi:hypothetical protein
MENDEKEDIKEWIKKKLKNDKKESTTVPKILIEISKLQEFNNNKKENSRKKHEILFVGIFVLLFFITIILIYLLSFSASCNNLKYLYSNLEKCNGKLISLSGVAFTDSSNLSDQGNPFYLEKNGYLIDVRGLNNIKSGERISLSGKIITNPIIFINATSGKKEGIIQNYKIEKVCEEAGMKIETIDKAKEMGRLFVINLTLLNYSTLLSKNNRFVYILGWNETTLKSFTILDVNTTFDVGKKYRVCGIVLSSYERILRIFLIK